MDKPNVIYAAAYDPSLERGFLTCSTVPMKHDDVKYIYKDALLDYLQKELERLWELMPDASNETPTQMEMRYLGEYVATERLIDEIKSL